MKELEKVKRISIVSILFILAILAGVLTFERPKNMYAIDTAQTLEKLIDKDYFVTMEQMNDPNLVLIDVRSPFEFNKGYLENAINIPSVEILSDENQNIFNEIKDSNKIALLYGENPEEANIPFTILYQLGFENLKILATDITYDQNKIVTTNSILEKSQGDIKAYIEESVKKVEAASANAIKQVKPAPKKVITVKKKKKKPVEGGC
jgi:rhodanese-related sulfurtransferase